MCHKTTKPKTQKDESRLDLIQENSNIWLKYKQPSA